MLIDGLCPPCQGTVLARTAGIHWLRAPLAADHSRNAAAGPGARGWQRARLPHNGSELDVVDERLLRPVSAIRHKLSDH